MSYYVVNANGGRGTHIMLSGSPSTPGMASDIAVQIIIGGSVAKATLCGLRATRYVSVFTPGEVSCRECRRRWLIATGQVATPPVPAVDVTGNRRKLLTGIVGVAVLIGITWGLAVILQFHGSNGGLPGTGYSPPAAAASAAASPTPGPAEETCQALAVNAGPDGSGAVAGGALPSNLQDIGSFTYFDSPNPNFAADLTAVYDASASGNASGLPTAQQVATLQADCNAVGVTSAIWPAGETSG
jgi:hypothetical protein